jgi:hypothetical protein
MEETIDKVKEKAKDVKVKVVGNTKDVVDAAKYSVSTSPQTTSSESVAYFHETEKSPDNKYEKSAQGPDYVKIDSLTEYREKEPIITPAPTMGVPEPIVSASGNSIDTFDKTRSNQQDSYSENSSDFFNPFVMGLRMWQNYSTMCMDYYREFLNTTTKKAKDYGNTWS